MNLTQKHGMPFSIRTRQEILHRYQEFRRKLRELQFALSEKDSTQEPSSFDSDIKNLSDSLSAIMEDYKNGLPKIPISRCPLTETMVIHSIDPFGIDGPWWDSRSPLRPKEDLPSTFVDVKGALHLNDPIETTPFVVRPGPDVPYVLPSVLEESGVIGVLSSIKIGIHDGYIICYFSDTKENITTVGNPWGIVGYSRTDEGDDHYGWVDVDIPLDEMDFDLERWILTGKLQWIKPGDPMLLLQNGLENCPYINLPGVRKNQIIYNGRRVYD